MSVDCCILLSGDAAAGGCVRRAAVYSPSWLNCPFFPPAAAAARSAESIWSLCQAWISYMVNRSYAGLCWRHRPNYSDWNAIVIWSSVSPSEVVLLCSLSSVSDESMLLLKTTLIAFQCSPLPFCYRKELPVRGRGGGRNVCLWWKSVCGEFISF